MIVVADTSPLNYLIRIEKIEILYTLYHEVLIPTAVLTELQSRKAPEVVRSWAADTPHWIRIQSPTSPPRFELDGLDLGESAALELALEIRATTLLIDERRARSVAETKFGFQVFGTLGVLQAAHNAGLIDGAEALEILSSLTNFYLSREVRSLFLASLKP